MICEDAYDNRIMGMAVDFFRLVQDAGMNEDRVWRDMKKQVELINRGGGIRR
jgi:hypothetical protein